MQKRGYQTWNSKGIKEKEVVELWEQGLGVTEIGRVLGCSGVNIKNNYLQKMGLYDKEEVRDRGFKAISKAMKEVRKRIPNPVEQEKVRDKISLTVSKRWEEGVFDGVSDKISDLWKQGGTYDDVPAKVSEFQKVYSNRPEIKELRRQAAQKSWENKDERLRVLSKSWGKKPTKPELMMEEFLAKHYPEEYIYVGDGKRGTVINGMIPDFIHNKGVKKVIEVFGDYWHRGEDPQDRIDAFAEYGWDCLVIWEHEIKGEINEVMEKVQKFVG